MKKWMILKGIKFAALAILGVILISYVVMLLWNNLIPELFNGPHVTWLQALGLLVLGKILFGGFHKRCSCSNKEHWKEKLDDKLSTLTPEERERFRSQMSEKCRRFF